MIFAGALGRRPGRPGGGFRPRGPIRRGWRPRGYYVAPAYAYPETLVVAAPVCATAPTPPPACAGTLVWRGPNTVCCVP